MLLVNVSEGNLRRVPLRSVKCTFLSVGNALTSLSSVLTQLVISSLLASKTCGAGLIIGSYIVNLERHLGTLRNRALILRPEGIEGLRFGTHISMVWEVKTTKAEDPIHKDGKVETTNKIAKGARSIRVAHNSKSWRGPHVRSALGQWLLVAFQRSSPSFYCQCAVITCNRHIGCLNSRSNKLQIVVYLTSGLPQDEFI